MTDKIMLLRPKIVSNTKYEAGITFPNKNVPELTPQLHNYVTLGWAKYVEPDKVLELPPEVAENVGKVTLPPLPVEEKKEKAQPFENIIKEEKKPKYKSVGKKEK